VNKQLNFEEIRTDAQARIATIGTNRSPIALLCDGLSDAQNIGAMFRIADAPAPRNNMSLLPTSTRPPKSPR
jgi:tRNA G18 (ribose-2'-O)-methylase SpoU